VTVAPTTGWVAVRDRAGASRAIAGAREAALHEGLAVCLAVVDRTGHLLAFERMDGAPVLSIQVAQDKAYSVAAFNGLPTHAWRPILQSDPALLHGFVKTERLTVFGGGVPVLVDGELVGVVGVSGGSAEQDARIAAAGAAAAVDGVTTS
jgi:glc operon protein GlcG